MRRNVRDISFLALLFALPAVTFQQWRATPAAEAAAAPAVVCEHVQREPLVPQISRPISRPAPIEVRDAFGSAEPQAVARPRPVVRMAGKGDPFAARCGGQRHRHRCH